MQDIFVVGDVHGCYNTFLKLYEKIKHGKIIMVGDIIDKGHHSKDMVEFCINNNIDVVRGNHEQFFIHHMNAHLNKDLNVYNTKWCKEWGGDTTLSSYDNNVNVIKTHLEFISSLPYYKEIKVNNNNFFITHGFGLPYYDVKDINHTALMSNRLYGSYYDITNVDELSKHNVINIFGHDAFVDVQSHSLYHGIDTGCAYGKTTKTGGKLSAIRLNDLTIIEENVIDKVTYTNDYY